MHDGAELGTSCLTRSGLPTEPRAALGAGRAPLRLALPARLSTSRAALPACGEALAPRPIMLRPGQPGLRQPLSLKARPSRADCVGQAVVGAAGAEHCRTRSRRRGIRARHQMAHGQEPGGGPDAGYEAVLPAAGLGGEEDKQPARQHRQCGGQPAGRIACCFAGGDTRHLSRPPPGSGPRPDASGSTRCCRCWCRLPADPGSCCAAPRPNGAALPWSPQGSGGWSSATGSRLAQLPGSLPAGQVLPVLGGPDEMDPSHHHQNQARTVPPSMTLTVPVA
jgi:hypothetical protein